MSGGAAWSAILVAACLGPLAARASEPMEPVLPPLELWQGESLELAVPSDHPWATPFERGGMVSTPSYDETISWLERLVAVAPELRMVPHVEPSIPVGGPGVC